MSNCTQALNGVLQRDYYARQPALITLNLQIIRHECDQSGCNRADRTHTGSPITTVGETLTHRLQMIVVVSLVAWPMRSFPAACTNHASQGSFHNCHKVHLLAKITRIKDKKDILHANKIKDSFNIHFILPVTSILRQNGSQVKFPLHSW